MLKITEVIKYKVKDGDSIESLSKSHNMSWQELAKFNFGTDEPDEINHFLRSQVGCFKKTKDKKNFVFTSKDDPGIIYIPKNLKKRTFGTNRSHPITVEQLKPKEFIPSKVMVYFRPKVDWKGEYGFDWLRVIDDVLLKTSESTWISTEHYEDIINGGYNGVPYSTGHTKDEALKQLKEREYRIMKTHIPEEPEYFVPYLNLFPKGIEGLELAPCQAELQIGVAVRDEEPLVIDLEYNRNLFQVDKDVLSDKAVNKKKLSDDGTLRITCIHEFEDTQEIKVLAYPKTWRLGEPIPVAGKIVVCPNNDIKELKLILIRVKTKIDGISEFLGEFTSKEKQNLKNALHQALVLGDMEDYTKENNIFDEEIDIVSQLLSMDMGETNFLDLSGDPHFQFSEGIAGKFVDEATLELNIGYREEDEEEQALFPYLENAFREQVGSDKYDNHFLVFAFAERVTLSKGRILLGQIKSTNDVFQKNLILFSGRDNLTLNHEVLHGLGLRHTHKEKPEDEFEPNEAATYTFNFETTDNVMSYASNPFSTWHWQWSLLRKSLASIE
ncbi:LysM peptidoglycan-binding domain-containing protein [Dyadobacter fanqingshengii]|uniref:LysM peptidoglycan-binding domain-containing protein n=1 Tax=Dyadobacter fanqingshengii TaxID=2906443 RepID=A0A9X1PAV4_9BACT|nr:LysM peptidoglycan-binding domain-containing protein [Dyadobacter fanqingshengii]MCF0040065.1 LysM peptidoglycan-binding domain-containing protein [Dyadobacter fanqingshengii]USJ38183.1 LysM peptidoglycan-binding domain-containing protein [Dyadobacter fanqingshengii]